jgi:hypothetical protein
MTKKQIREELRSILKDFHYESDTEQMSKDVVIALENLVGDLKPSTLPKEILVRTWEVE